MSKNRYTTPELFSWAAFAGRAVAGPLERGHDPWTPRATGQFVETLFMVTRATVRAPRHQAEVPREQHVVFLAHLADEPSSLAQLQIANQTDKQTTYTLNERDHRCTPV